MRSFLRVNWSPNAYEVLNGLTLSERARAGADVEVQIQAGLVRGKFVNKFVNGTRFRCAVQIRETNSQ